MKKFLIIFGLVLGFASAVYANHFCCSGSKEECCAKKGKLYCENDNTCRTRCKCEPDKCCGCINPDGKCCTWCPTAEVCARMNKCQKIDENGCYTCAECDEDCPSPKCLNDEGICCSGCPRVCPEGRSLINMSGCYICGDNCTEGEILMSDGSCQSCVDGYNAYCNTVNDAGIETATTKACIGIGCTTTALEECTVQQIDYAQACCTSEQTIYCSSYNEEGKCIVASCYSGTCTPYVREYYENGNPKTGSCCSGTPYVSGTYDDGTPKYGSCCSSGYKVVSVKISATENAPDGGYVNECVRSGYTAYCSEYDENGKCTSVSTSSSACTPYVSDYYENGNPKTGGCSSSVGCTPYVSSYYENGNPKSGYYCDTSSKTLTEFDAPNGSKVGVCHNSFEFAYCSSYNADGKCIGATTSLVKDCKPYRKSATEGDCCAGTLETVEDSPYPVCSNRL